VSDERIFPGPPRRGGGHFQIGPTPPLAYVGPPGPGRRRRLRLHLAGLLVVGLFAAVQLYWFRDGRRQYWGKPTPVLGPLYHLVCRSSGPADRAWAYAQLVVLVPCVLAFPVRPSPATAGVTLLAILVWTGPGILEVMDRLG
jgi:hypothetical protein